MSTFPNITDIIKPYKFKPFGRGLFIVCLRAYGFKTYPCAVILLE